MPNKGNANAPIFIAGSGRSGTTWIMKILESHPDVQAVIENSLACTVYHQFCTSWWARAFLNDVCSDNEARQKSEAARIMRETLCVAFPSDRPRWVMKTIWGVQSTWGVPLDVWCAAFPAARLIHCIRDPRTAIPSMFDFLGNYPHLKTLAACEESFRAGHEDTLELAAAGVPCLRFRLEDAAADPVRAWRNLCSFCGLREADAPREVLGSRMNTRDERPGDRPPSTPPLAWDALRPRTLELAREFGYAVPAGCAGRAADPPAPPAPSIAELEQRISDLAGENSRLRSQLYTVLNSPPPADAP